MWGFKSPLAHRPDRADRTDGFLVVSQPLNDRAGNGEWLLTVNLHAELGQQRVPLSNAADLAALIGIVPSLVGKLTQAEIVWCWYQDCYRRSAIKIAKEVEVSVMCLDDAGDDRQAETGTRLGTAGVGSPESVECMRDTRGVHAWTIVGNHE